MTEISDFWLALWHDAWEPWDGLWLFQVTQRPIDRALVGGPDEEAGAFDGWRSEGGIRTAVVAS